MARILVVDDDPDVLKMAEKVLAQADYDVFVASGAMQALDLLNSAPFDALVSDANMPKCSGFELVKNVKGHKRFENMAIAMLTGLREKKDIEKAIRLGVDDYIVKPIDPLRFVRKIEGLFRKKPPEHRSEVELEPGSPQSQGQVYNAITITNLSEQGLKIRSSHPHSVGDVITLEAALFHSLKMEPVNVRVLASKQVDEATYETQLGFIKPNEKLLNRIRNYIDKHQHKSAS